MESARIYHTATLLSSGKVLVTGGNNGANFVQPALSSAELLDPASGSFTRTADLTEARTTHTATMLATGEVLVVGGANAGFTDMLATAELYQ